MSIDGFWGSNSEKRLVGEQQEAVIFLPAMHMHKCEVHSPIASELNVILKMHDF